MVGLSGLAELLPGCASELPVVLRMEDVHLSFAGVKAIDGVSLEVSGDELFAIIGPNGAGKSSLFNCVSGVYRPQRGTIEVLGRSVIGERPAAIAARGVARTFQSIALFDSLTVLDNLMLGRHVHVGYGVLAAMRRSARAREEELRHRAVVEELIGFLEIGRHRDAVVGTLPYGVRKRVELGRALAMEPKLMLLDEPVAGMSREETEDMARFVLQIRRELRVGMLLVEHHMDIVMDLADRVLVLDFGTPVACGSPAAVQSDPAVIDAYLGVASGP